MKTYTPSGKVGFSYFPLSVIYLALSAAIGFGWGSLSPWLGELYRWLETLEPRRILVFSTAFVLLFATPILLSWLLNRLAIFTLYQGHCRNVFRAILTSSLATASLYFSMQVAYLLYDQTPHLSSWGESVFLSTLQLPPYLRYFLVLGEFFALLSILLYWTKDHLKRPYCETCGEWFVEKEKIFFPPETKSSLLECLKQTEIVALPNSTPQLSSLEIRSLLCPKCNGFSGSLLILYEGEAKDEEFKDALVERMLSSQERQILLEQIPLGHLHHIQETPLENRNG